MSRTVDIMSNYHLPDGYNERLENAEWDDTTLEDEWQNEVYFLALQIFLENRFTSVCDLGCGSGFKLMKYFSDFDTIGIELSKTVEYLKSRYPTRTWMSEGEQPPKADMIICADVLEHVPNPDNVMEFISNIHPRKVVLSTPARDLRPDEPMFGPPNHWPHCREWSQSEFKDYVQDWFTIEQGPLIFGPQNVQQLVVCVLK